MSATDEPTPWPIAMLGAASAGKTCYISTFYGNFSADLNPESENRTGFTVYGDSYTRGTLKGFAEALADNPPETPNPTIRIENYTLTLSSAGEDGLIDRELQLHDHAGEALKGSTDPQKAEEFDQVLRTLGRASAFLVFLDTKKVLGSAPDKVASEVEWPTIHGILTRVAMRLGHEGDTLPVVLVLSKFDAAEDDEQRSLVMGYARTCVEKLMSVSKNLTVLICPVSVLKEAGSGALERNLLNMPAPFLFISAAIINRNAAWHAARADDYRSDARRIERKMRANRESARGFFGGFRSLFANARLWIQRKVAIDPAIDREVVLHENDLEFAEKALVYLERTDNTSYTVVNHRGLEMSLQDYIGTQFKGGIHG